MGYICKSLLPTGLPRLSFRDLKLLFFISLLQTETNITLIYDTPDRLYCHQTDTQFYFSPLLFFSFLANLLHLFLSGIFSAIYTQKKRVQFNFLYNRNSLKRCFCAVRHIAVPTTILFGSSPTCLFTRLDRV